MTQWLAFKVRVESDAAFAEALRTFKAAIPSTSRRWDSEHRYWLFDPSFAEEVQAITTAAIVPAVTLAEDDRRLGRVPVRDDEELDTALIDLQYGDLVAADGIGRIQGNPAARQEFERRLREAEQR